MRSISDSAPRRGARTMKSVPEEVLQRLALGECETVNLMEWLAADMRLLAQNLSREAGQRTIGQVLSEVAPELGGLSITGRLKAVGDAIASEVSGGAQFDWLADHRSDLVRQWACYAVNSTRLSLSLDERLQRTLRFAADHNMTVRETAWMAFRPHLIKELGVGLKLLAAVAESSDHNVRRFAVEVTRPRSVWGEHIHELKRGPELAFDIISRVRGDSSRYVQLAMGNWLNDASKTRPDWVVKVCEAWTSEGNKNTDYIVRRGLRSLRKIPSLPLLVIEEAALSGGQQC